MERARLIRAKWLVQSVLLWAITLTVSTDAVAQYAIAVVVDRDAEREIDRSTLVGVYRRSIVVDNYGMPYVPVNLPASDAVRQEFSQQIFDRSPAEMSRYWTERYYHGVSPPFVLASSEAVLRFVSTTAGAVGYVLDCHVDERVRVLMLLPLPEAAGHLRSSCADPGRGRDMR